MQTSTSEKYAEQRSETKSSNSFNVMVGFHFKSLMKVQRHWGRFIFILKPHVFITFSVVIHLTTILHGNYSDLTLICQS